MKLAELLKVDTTKENWFKLLSKKGINPKTVNVVSKGGEGDNIPFDERNFLEEALKEYPYFVYEYRSSGAHTFNNEKINKVLLMDTIPVYHVNLSYDYVVKNQAGNSFYLGESINRNEPVDPIMLVVAHGMPVDEEEKEGLVLFVGMRNTTNEVDALSLTGISFYIYLKKEE